MEGVIVDCVKKIRVYEGMLLKNLEQTLGLEVTDSIKSIRSLRDVDMVGLNEKLREHELRAVRKHLVETWGMMVEGHIDDLDLSLMKSLHTVAIFGGKGIDVSLLTVNKNEICRGPLGSEHQGIYNRREVAVKVLVLEDELDRKDQALKREFFQEVAVRSKLDHPNITKFIGAAEKKDVVSGDTSCYMVSESLEGGTLKHYLMKNSRAKLSLEKVVELALDMARGLSYLHSQNITHGDVKTENMHLDKSSKLKVAGFEVTSGQTSGRCAMRALSATLRYMVPEVLQGKAYDTKSDVYSFGICLWEIYCCDLPCPADKFVSGSAAIRKKDLRPKIPGCCPKPLARLMKSCWASNPNIRPDMKDVVSTLKAVDTSIRGGMIPHGEDQAGCFRLFHRR